MEKTWVDEQGAVFSEDKKTLLQCPDVENYTIPDHADTVSEYAFDRAPNIRSINFNKVRKIPSRSTLVTREVPYFNGARWEGYETEEEMHYYSLFTRCPFVEKIIFSDPYEIGLFAFAGLKNLTAFSTPNYRQFCPLVLFASGIKELRANGSFIEPEFKYTSTFIDQEGNEYTRSAFNDISICFPVLEKCYINMGYPGNVIDKIARCRSLKTIILPESIKSRYNLQIQYVWEDF